MLQKALEAYKSGGDQGLKDWYEALTREQRQEFQQDVKAFFDNLSGSFGGMGKIIADMFSSFSVLFDDLPGEAPTEAAGPQPTEPPQ
jgi:hypothetical protein